MSDPKDETPPNCTVCEKPMTFHWFDYLCDVPEHNWTMAREFIAENNIVDMTDPHLNRLRSLLERIRPDVEVAGWVYRELELILTIKNYEDAVANDDYEAIKYEEILIERTRKELADYKDLYGEGEMNQDFIYDKLCEIEKTLYSLSSAMGDDSEYMWTHLHDVTEMVRQLRETVENA